MKQIAWTSDEGNWHSGRSVASVDCCGAGVSVIFDEEIVAVYAIMRDT